LLQALRPLAPSATLRTGLSASAPLASGPAYTTAPAPFASWHRVVLREARARASFLRSSAAAQARLSVWLQRCTSPAWAHRDDGLVHDMPDRACATPTRRNTAKVTKELTSGARRRAGCHRGTHVVVAQHVAGANDHDSSPPTRRRARRIAAERGSSNTRCYPRDLPPPKPPPLPSLGDEGTGRVLRP
jgi:hypothetical protein